MLKQEFNKAEELGAQFKAYVQTEIELAKLTVAEKLSKLLSKFIAVLFVSAVFLLFLLFVSLAMAYLVGEWLGQVWAGFLCVALFYLLTGLITWYARGKIIRVPIMNAIIRQLFHNDQEDNNKTT